MVVIDVRCRFPESVPSQVMIPSNYQVAPADRAISVFFLFMVHYFVGSFPRKYVEGSTFHPLKISQVVLARIVFKTGSGWKLV